nr:MAG TPA: hypothetical protein [Caudoviricetes sp.]
MYIKGSYTPFWQVSTCQRCQPFFIWFPQTAHFFLGDFSGITNPCRPLSPYKNRQNHSFSVTLYNKPLFYERIY